MIFRYIIFIYAVLFSAFANGIAEHKVVALPSGEKAVVLTRDERAEILLKAPDKYLVDHYKELFERQKLLNKKISPIYITEEFLNDSIKNATPIDLDKPAYQFSKEDEDQVIIDMRNILNKVLKNNNDNKKSKLSLMDRILSLPTHKAARIIRFMIGKPDLFFNGRIAQEFMK
jgi:hypothetical protein